MPFACFEQILWVLREIRRRRNPMRGLALVPRKHRKIERGFPSLANSKCKSGSDRACDLECEGHDRHRRGHRGGRWLYGRRPASFRKHRHRYRHRDRSCRQPPGVDSTAINNDERRSKRHANRYKELVDRYALSVGSFDLYQRLAIRTALVAAPRRKLSPMTVMHSVLPLLSRSS
jgi:hypothetical protein